MTHIQLDIYEYLDLILGITIFNLHVSLLYQIYVFILLKKFLFIIFDCSGSSMQHRLSLDAANGGFSLVAVGGLLTAVASLVVETGSKGHGLQ